MQDVLLQMYKSLKSSAAVGTQFAGVYNNPRAPDKAGFPRLTMFEVLREDTDYADDKAIFDETVVRVDIWSKKNDLHKLSGIVKTALTQSFEWCEVQLQSSMYEEDTHIYHKPINVTIKMEV